VCDIQTARFLRILGCIATRYGLDGPGFEPGSGKLLLPLHVHPARIWDLSSRLSDGYQELQPFGALFGA